MSDTAAIQLDGISKTFGRGKRRVYALRGIHLDVAPGQVYGFLGPNGAGKTTTIRILLNLVRATTGGVRVLGVDPRRDPSVLRRVGAQVESPSFYGYLSGRANLQVLARTGGIENLKRIDHLLNQVGLGARASQRVSGYSLGMRQRLGLAAALLADPPLMVFDEPTNGLDPAGIQEMRVLIRDLVENQGKTVFLSSHLLNEVEQVCDRVAIIHRGELVREGTVAELLGAQARVRIAAEPLETAESLLIERWPVVREDKMLLVQAARAQIPDLVRRLVEGGAQVYQVGEERLTLEDYFLSVTHGETTE
ncbi:MAG TPA: ABC transporter ATP-binding protein [Candidatus Limnocylindrales bacterium]|nr:ABC transporter ATP-binding protein [Candidatus Limnocylindrales bacterium]